MRFFTLAAAALGAVLAVASAEPVPGCAFGGQGAALALGMGTFPIPDANSGKNVAVVLPMAAVSSGGETAEPWVMVLVAPQSGPDNSLAGWLITQNATSQTLTFWSNFTGAAPACHSASVQLPDAYTPGFSMCGGDLPSALFPVVARNYTLAGLEVGVYAQAPSGAELSMTSAPAFALVSLFVAESPLGTGAFSISFESGVPAAPAWGKAPAWCSAA
jgi:hypothetical protein